jgi:hypothetical protein
MAEALGDEGLLLDQATLRMRASLLTPEENAIDSEAILKRLEALRDPIRLKEHLFWMIAPTYHAGRLQRSVEVADRAIEIAARLGVPPVQYPTFKALPLIALGRFDEAWEAIGREVTHGAYRFGAALQTWGYAVLKCQAGAGDLVLGELEPLVEECRALNRFWMIESLVDTVAMACAREGHLSQVLTVLDVVAPDHRPRGSARIEVMLAQGDAAAALEQARRTQADLAHEGRWLLEAEAGEIALRCHAALEAWSDLHAEADRLLGWCEASGGRLLHWRILAHRAQAREALGDLVRARADLEAARGLLHIVSETMPLPELKAAFLSQVTAKLVLDRP